LFHPRWKEELVCTSAAGILGLEYPMGGRPITYLPTEESWRNRAPEWARDLWFAMKGDLEAWCTETGTRLVISETADIYSTRE
jgi:hypothetical protein